MKRKLEEILFTLLQGYGCNWNGSRVAFNRSNESSADVLALATVEVDLEPLQPGQSISVLWRGNPLFIRYRTEEEISEAKDIDLNSLKDPELDEDRAENAKYLVMIGLYPSWLVPLGQEGEYGGWFCPCHGSHYDTSGRIRKGPAPTNLRNSSLCFYR